ncbi:MAG TPA: carbohydrate ABC transporter permease [Stackebrandtia sp.]|uniref:carbohydrate ABC transporter permease n=1 Tax=Stackebrandtia sp. TaxID=2023065 RepID=UPI002D6ED844|nr:carbohydrate ABC transporter permease [Stackebrandtia sp.]HZE41503.1 carbohydrate ABC transporter permease [Stackebrandtia sp.]
MPTTDNRTLISPSALRRPAGRATYLVVTIATALVFAAAFVFPLYWMVTGALKSSHELAQPTPSLVPHGLHPDSFTNAWDTLQIGHYFLNTVGYAAGGWLVQLVVDVCAAYALSRLRPWGGRAILGMMLAGLMLPPVALLVPAYLTVSDVPLLGLNLLNTPWALWLPAAANAFNIYVLKRFFDQLPQELLDAADIDGAGRLRILWSIVLPLSRPVLAVVSIFAVIGMWKDFLWPLIVLPDPDSQTLSVALSHLAGTGYVPANTMMAGLVITSVPMLVVYLALQRHILSGLSIGAIKG